MKNCKNYGRYPFCNQCVNTDNICADYQATYENTEQHIPRID